jgi:hypothetical protein
MESHVKCLLNQFDLQYSLIWILVDFFCLNNLFINEWEVLKSPTIIIVKFSLPLGLIVCVL